MIKINSADTTEKLKRLGHLNHIFKGKQKYVVEMTDIFLAQMPETLVNIEQHIAVKNKQGVYYEAHTIKSSINIINLVGLKPLILELENCREQDWESIEIQYAIFRKKVNQEIRLIQEDRKLLISSMSAAGASA